MPAFFCDLHRSVADYELLSAAACDLAGKPSVSEDGWRMLRAGVAAARRRAERLAELEDHSAGTVGALNADLLDREGPAAVLARAWARLARAIADNHDELRRLPSGADLRAVLAAA